MNDRLSAHTQLGLVVQLLIIQISKVTIKFLVLWLVEMNRLCCDRLLTAYVVTRGDYHMSLEILSEFGIIVLTDDF